MQPAGGTLLSPPPPAAILAPPLPLLLPPPIKLPHWCALPAASGEAGGSGHQPRRHQEGQGCGWAAQSHAWCRCGACTQVLTEAALNQCHHLTRPRPRSAGYHTCESLLMNTRKVTARCKHQAAEDWICIALRLQPADLPLHPSLPAAEAVGDQGPVRRKGGEDAG